jgi:hypothetical protein
VSAAAEHNDDLIEVRPYDPSSDENVCVYMWVWSYLSHATRSRRLWKAWDLSQHNNGRRGYIESQVDTRDGWEVLAPVVRRMLHERRCDVLCVASDPDTVLGWICYELDPLPLLHGMAIKSSLTGDVKLGKDWTVIVDFAKELLAPLLESKLPVGITMEIPFLSWNEIKAAGWQRPNSWYQDDTYYARRWAHG